MPGGSDQESMRVLTLLSTKPGGIISAGNAPPLDEKFITCSFYLPNSRLDGHPQRFPTQLATCPPFLLSSYIHNSASKSKELSPLPSSQYLIFASTAVTISDGIQIPRRKRLSKLISSQNATTIAFARQARDADHRLSSPSFCHLTDTTMALAHSTVPLAALRHLLKTPPLQFLRLVILLGSLLGPVDRLPPAPRRRGGEPLHRGHDHG